MPYMADDYRKMPVGTELVSIHDMRYRKRPEGDWESLTDPAWGPLTNSELPTTLKVSKIGHPTIEREHTMADPKSLDVNVEVRFNTRYPKVPSTMQERMDAARVAKPLLAGTTPITSSAVGVSELIRMAEYLATGHDYFDTHPSKDSAKLSKKERRKRAKEIRKIVVEEVGKKVEETRTNAGTLIMPEVLVERADGTQYVPPNPWAPKGKEGKGNE